MSSRSDVLVAVFVVVVSEEIAREVTLGVPAAVLVVTTRPDVDPLIDPLVVPALLVVAEVVATVLAIASVVTEMVLTEEDVRVLACKVAVALPVLVVVVLMAVLVEVLVAVSLVAVSLVVNVTDDEVAVVVFAVVLGSVVPVVVGISVRVVRATEVRSPLTPTDVASRAVAGPAVVSAKPAVDVAAIDAVVAVHDDTTWVAKGSNVKKLSPYTPYVEDRHGNMRRTSVAPSCVNTDTSIATSTVCDCCVGSVNMVLKRPSTGPSSRTTT